jgi:glycerophosphoryl diester phosphodiesterase
MLRLGHRGSPKTFPENTLASFRDALERGLDGIETDLQPTKDGHLLIHHDEHLADGKRISTLNLEEIQSQYPELMSLEELLEWSLSQSVIEKGAPTLNLELKNSHNANDGREKLLHTVLERVLPESHPVRQNLIISCFNPLSIWRLSRLSSSYRLGFLYGGGGPVSLHALAWMLPVYSLHPHYSLLSFDVLERARRKNLEVIPWTVNERMLVERYERWGIYGVIGDYPDVLKAHET